MFSKASFVFAAFAVAAQLASAQTPPACLLAAVNTNVNPADVSGICKKSDDMGDKLIDMCGSNLEAAQQAFIRICGNAGVSVKLTTPTASASSTGKDANPTSSTGSRSTAPSVSTSQSSDESCSSCTTTTSTTAATNDPAETGLITVAGGTGNGTQASATGTSTGTSSGTGTPQATSSTGTGSAGSSTPTGAANQIQVAGLSLGAIAMAGLAIAL